MVKYAIDISKWNSDTPAYFQAHKKNGVEFVFVQLSYAVGYPNPKRFNQINNTKKYIGLDRVGAYHYLYSNNNAANEAKEFLAYLKQAGLNTDTPVAIDTERDSNGATNAINTFSKILANAGYKRILVYSMYSWFSAGTINRGKLKYNNLWIANYGTKNPGISGSKLWQYTDSGLDSTDYNVIYDWEFLVSSKPTAFVRNGSQFKVKTDKVLEYSDLNFRYKTGARFTTGSIINGSPVKHAGIYRIKTASGYISANANYVKKIK